MIHVNIDSFKQNNLGKCSFLWNLHLMDRLSVWEWMEIGIEIPLQNSIDIFLSIFLAVQAIQVAIYL